MVINGYKNKWEFPNCSGVIDVCHIQIIQPKENLDDYINRKGYYSLIIQGVCDHRYMLQDFNIGWPGKVHEARVLANSNIYQSGEDGTLFPENMTMKINICDNEAPIPICIVGHPAYQLRNWLMEPYPGCSALSHTQTFSTNALTTLE